MILCPCCGTVPAERSGTRPNCGCGMLRGPFVNPVGSWFFGRRLRDRVSFGGDRATRHLLQPPPPGMDYVTELSPEEVPDAVREIIVSSVLDE